MGGEEGTNFGETARLVHGYVMVCWLLVDQGRLDARRTLGLKGSCSSLKA